MSATEQAPSPLPAGDELAWVDYLAATTVGKAGEIVEYLEEAFHFEEIDEDGKTVLR